MQDDERLIIEVSCQGYPDYQVVNKFFNGNGELECVYTTDKEGRPLSIGFDYNFVYINQQKNVEEIIRNIVNRTTKTKIRIAVHRTENPIEKVKAGVENSNNKERVIGSPKEFNHEESDLLWNTGLKPFIVESIGNNFEDYQAKFDSLWNLLAPSPADITHSLRSQILTPLVSLHLILQMEPKERESCLKSISESEENRAFAEAGLALLKGNDSELKKKISELSGTPFNEDKIKKFIQVYAKPLYDIFQGIITNSQIKPSDVDVLAGIKQLSKIVEDEIEKSDLKKKARVIKHDLDNVMRRLDNCKSPLTPEKRGVMKSGMEMLDSIFKELNTLKETLHLDIQAELESASKLVQKIREGITTNLEESRLLELRDELVSALQEPFNMIVSVTTGQEK